MNVYAPSFSSTVNLLAYAQKGSVMKIFLKSFFLLLTMICIVSPTLASNQHTEVTITFRGTPDGNGVAPVWTNPQYGEPLQHPSLPNSMLTPSTTLYFTFEASHTNGFLVFMLKNKKQSHWSDGQPNPEPQRETYEEFLKVSIPLSQSGPNNVHAITIGNAIQATNIQWSQAIYMGFFAESGNTSQTNAFCNNTQIGGSWSDVYLVSPEFKLRVLFDKGTHPNLPSASLSEGSNSHGFTNMGQTIGSLPVHGAISNYFYELEDAATTGNAFPLGDRIWELYGINSTNGTGLTFIRSVPGEGNGGSFCRFQVPQHTTNGTRYLLLCRTVDVTGHAGMARPTSTNDAGLGNNAFVFEVGKDVTKNPDNCLAISYSNLANSTLTVPSCNLAHVSDGRIHVMPHSTGSVSDFDTSPETEETFTIRWRGRVSGLNIHPEKSIVPIPTTPDAAIYDWPEIPTSQGDMPLLIEWQYKNAYGTTTFSATKNVAYQEPNPPPFQARLDAVDWLSHPLSPVPGASFGLTYQAVTPPTGLPPRNVVVATAWLYQIENNEVVRSKILSDPSGEKCFQLTADDTPHSLDLVLPETIETWNLSSGAELKVRLKAEWRADGDCTANFLNAFGVLPTNSENYALADSSSWHIGGSEPGHFTDLYQGNGTNQVRLTTGDMDLLLQETHTGNPEPQLAWRWETTVGGSTYLWLGGSWVPADSINNSQKWMELDTGVISTGGSDVFSSRWEWRPSGKIQPKNRINGSLPTPLAPLPNSTALLVAPFFTPNGTNQVETLAVTIRVRMFFPGYHEEQANTVTLNLLEPEPGIEAFQFALAAEGTTPACGESTDWLETTDYFGRLGNLPRMQFSLVTTGTQANPIRLRIEKQITQGVFTQLSCHEVDSALFASACQNTTPGIGENLQRWWVADADTDPNVDNFFDILANAGPGTFRIRLTTKDCNLPADGDAAVIFTLNPEESFALRIHYRDHIGSSTISRAYTPNLAGAMGNTAPFNLKVGTQSLALYAQQPQWTHYEPFGKAWDNVESEPNPRYTDHEFDMQTGFNYMKGRYQLPDSGRFNRPDPMRDWDWENPSSMNLYQYVRNNPIMGVDPTGFERLFDQESGQWYIEYFDENNDVQKYFLSDEQNRRWADYLNGTERIHNVKFIESLDYFSSSFMRDLQDRELIVESAILEFAGIEFTSVTNMNSTTTTSVGSFVVNGSLSLAGPGIISNSVRLGGFGILYRGVNSADKLAHSNAMAGTVAPNLVKSWWQFWKGISPAQHTTAGTAGSQFTSWTTSLEVAKNFALRPSGKGVVLEAIVPWSKYINSGPAQQIYSIFSRKKIFESEVLLRNTWTNLQKIISRGMP